MKSQIGLISILYSGFLCAAQGDGGDYIVVRREAAEYIRMSESERNLFLVDQLHKLRDLYVAALPADDERARLVGEVARLTVRVSQMSGRCTVLQGRCNQLERDHRTLRQQKDELNEQIMHLRTQIDTQEIRLQVLRGLVSGVGVASEVQVARDEDGLVSPVGTVTTDIVPDDTGHDDE